MPTFNYVPHSREILEYVRRLPLGGFDDAACAVSDPDAYHPEVGVPLEADLERCERCGVGMACLALALRAEDPEFREGWYGGLSPDERSVLATRLGFVATPPRPTAAKARRAVALRDSGWKVGDIAVELSCSRRTIQRYLNDAA